MNIQQSLYAAVQQFTAITDQPLLDAEVLLAHALKKPRSFLHAWPEQKLTDEQQQLFVEYVRRRCDQEPIAYITAVREFWSLELLVTPDTLIPRPETELLVEYVLKNFDASKPLKVADLGTGSGAIALALAKERSGWRIYAADISENALQIARKNAQRLELTHISFYQGSWCTALPCKDFDVIVSNPPYIAETEWQDYSSGLKFEPLHALVSGKDGLEAIRVISQTTKACLKPGGYVIVEHGFLQGRAVRTIFADEGYSEIHSLRDLAGQERITVSRYIE